MVTEEVNSTWHRVAELDDLEEGRVKTVHVGRRTLVLTRYQDRYGCLDNACPHQGGPLGEGSIEKGWLRCPWHGYDYDPLDGTPPEGFSDGSPVFRPKSVRTASTSRSPTPHPVRGQSPTSWWRRWSTGASTVCSGWWATRTSVWPTRCAPPRSGVTSVTSEFGTKAPHRSQPRRTAS